MALNIVYDRIIEGLKKSKTVKMPIVVDEKDARSNEFLMVTLVNVVQEALPAGGKIFRYFFYLDYYAEYQDKRRLYQEVGDIWDQLGDNPHYASGGTEYFYNGEAISATFDEEDVDYKARIEWACDYMEIG